MAKKLSPLALTALSIWDQIEAELRVLPLRPSPDQLLDPRDLAALLSVSSRALEAWRREDRGPEVTKIGGAVRYRYADVLAWIAVQNSRRECPRATKPSTR